MNNTEKKALFDYFLSGKTRLDFQKDYRVKAWRVDRFLKGLKRELEENQ